MLAFLTIREINIEGVLGFDDTYGDFSVNAFVGGNRMRRSYEAILSINEYDCTFKMTEDIRSPDRMNNQLIALDFKRKNYRPIDNTEGFRNIYSTPWIGDLDNDGYLDIIYTQNFNPKDITRFLGMSIKRVSTAVRIKEAPKWGAYMGSQGNDIFEDWLHPYRHLRIWCIIDVVLKIPSLTIFVVSLKWRS